MNLVSHIPYLFSGLKLSFFSPVLSLQDLILSYKKRCPVLIFLNQNHTQLYDFSYHSGCDCKHMLMWPC